MENFLIVIIFIGSIIYKVYKNYKEEAEKAKNRNPQRRPAPSIPSQSTSVEQEYFPTNSRTRKPKVNAEPAYQNITLPEEVVKVKESKKTIIKPLVRESEEKNQPIQFDLRQAVIQSIILERPYK